MYKHYLDAGLIESNISKHDAIEIIKDKKQINMVNKAVSLIKHIDNFIKCYNMPIFDTTKDKILYADSLVFYLNKDNLASLVESFTCVGVGLVFDEELKADFDEDFLNQNAQIFIDIVKRAIDLYSIINVFESAGRPIAIIKERL